MTHEIKGSHLPPFQYYLRLKLCTKHKPAQDVFPCDFRVVVSLPGCSLRRGRNRICFGKYALTSFEMFSHLVARNPELNHALNVPLREHVIVISLGIGADALFKPLFLGKIFNRCPVLSSVIFLMQERNAAQRKIPSCVRLLLTRPYK